MKQLKILLLFFVIISCNQKKQADKNVNQQKIALKENVLVIGEKVENINITDFIENTPKEQDFSNKIKVIDFWATWCAPCLQAVPHFNDLQNEFENNPDIVFISLTDESPEKAGRILERINFTSIVASDQTKETLKNYKVNSLPQTVIVDQNNFVRWVGLPNELNTDIISTILQEEDWNPNKIIRTKSLDSTSSIKEDKAAVRMPQLLTQLRDSTSALYSFNLTFANSTDPKSSGFSMGEGKYLELNSDLKTILSKLVRKPSSEIIIPKKYADSTFNLLFKNSNINADNINMEVFLEQMELIKRNMLIALDLEEKIESRKTKVYILQVKDKSKLEPGSGDLMARYGSNDDYLTFSNVEISNLIGQISRFHNVILSDETSLDGKYDFLIDKNDFEKAKRDLLNYGISVDQSEKNIEFYIYE